MDVQVTNSFSVGLDISLREKYTQTPQAGPGGSLEYLAVTSPLQEAYIGWRLQVSRRRLVSIKSGSKITKPGLPEIYG